MFALSHELYRRNQTNFCFKIKIVLKPFNIQIKSVKLFKFPFNFALINFD